MPAAATRPVPPPHQRSITVYFISIAALLWTAALVLFNMRGISALPIFAILACAALSTVAVIIRLIVVKAREAAMRNSMDRYHGMMARTKREQARAEAAKEEQRGMNPKLVKPSYVRYSQYS